MLELPFRMRSSEEHLALTLKVWADAVRDYPLWAVQKAAKWWSRGARDGDELRHFTADVKLAAGGNALERKRLLESFSTKPAAGVQLGPVPEPRVLLCPPHRWLRPSQFESALLSRPTEVFAGCPD